MAEAFTNMNLPDLSFVNADENLVYMKLISYYYSQFGSALNPVPVRNKIS